MARENERKRSLPTQRWVGGHKEAEHELFKSLCPAAWGSEWVPFEKKSSPGQQISAPKEKQRACFF